MKKVLIITYYWPPSGGGGVQRWLKFSRYLPENGWKCIICTPDNPQFDQKDPSLLDEVLDETEVLTLPIWEPYSIFKKLSGGKSIEQGVTPGAGGKIPRFIRGNIFLPDPRVFWVQPAVRFLSSFLKERPVDLIVTTGPPHSMHLIGRKLRKRTHIPWIADFRDPWSKWDMLSEFYTTFAARKWHERQEKKVLETADRIITVSEPWAEDFRTLTSTMVSVIPNGFDPSDMVKKEKQVTSFRLVHFGLLNNFRNAPKLWQVLNRLCEEDDRFNEALEIVLGGMIASDVRKSLSEYPLLNRHVQMMPAISHERVMQEYNKAAVLVLLLNKTQNAKGHIPGKLFEYLGMGLPILAIGREKGATADIIDEMKAGKTIDWDDDSGIYETLVKWFSLYQTNSLTITPSSDLKLYSRQHLTKKLTEVMDIVSKNE